MELRGSIQAQFVETPSAKEAVLFANTPSFLLDRLRKDTSAAYVAQVLGTEAILDSLQKRCESPPQSALELLWIYVFLAALYLKDDARRFKDSLAAIDLSRVQWGDDIRNAIVQEKTPTNFLDIHYEKIGDNRQTDASTNVIEGKVFAAGVEQ